MRINEDYLDFLEVLDEDYNGNAETGIVDFKSLPEMYDESPESIARLNKWLRSHKDTTVRLYHGTGARRPIMQQGLLPTSVKRRNSYQSTSGYVYLSVWPSLARMFGELGNPYDEVVVYAVDIKVKELKPDLDQLYNKRATGAYDYAGNTLADSLIIGHGARVRRKIWPYEITVFES